VIITISPSSKERAYWIKQDAMQKMEVEGVAKGICKGVVNVLNHHGPITFSTSPTKNRGERHTTNAKVREWFFQHGLYSAITGFEAFRSVVFISMKHLGCASKKCGVFRSSVTL